MKTLKLISGFLILMVFSFSSYAQKKECQVSTRQMKKLPKKDIVVIDVRTSEEYREGHLRGALLIDVKDETFKEKIAELDKTRDYYVYCRSGKRSAHAQDLMLAMGFKNVCNVEGGILKMTEDNIPLVKE